MNARSVLNVPSSSWITSAQIAGVALRPDLSGHRRIGGAVTTSETTPPVQRSNTSQSMQWHMRGSRVTSEAYCRKTDDWEGARQRHIQGYAGMNISFGICVDIAARPERVWEVIIDIERWPDWNPSMKRIRRLDKGPLALGSRAFVRQPDVLPAVWKVTALEPNRTFTWTTSIPGLLSVVAIHSIEAIEQGSRVTLELNFGRVLWSHDGGRHKGAEQPLSGIRSSGPEAQERKLALNGRRRVKPALLDEGRVVPSVLLGPLDLRVGARSIYVSVRLR